MASRKFRDEFQNVDTVETVQEFIAVPVPKPDKKLTCVT
jgi:hypothetical protein